MPEFSATPQYKSKYTTGDTLIHTGPGILHTINIAATGAVSGTNAYIVYDGINTSGTIIFSIGQLTGGPSLTTHKGEYFLDIEFNTGLYVDHSGTVGANISYLPKYY